MLEVEVRSLFSREKLLDFEGCRDCLLTKRLEVEAAASLEEKDGPRSGRRRVW
jgi:hypothetical protein